MGVCYHLQQPWISEVLVPEGRGAVLSGGGGKKGNHWSFGQLWESGDFKAVSGHGTYPKTKIIQYLERKWILGF